MLRLSRMRSRSVWSPMAWERSMSQSTPDKRGPRIPFQPNPFASAALGSPWTEIADVPGINDSAFRTILRALHQIHAGARGTSVVVTGDPGSGKTHLLGRLRN